MSTDLLINIVLVALLVATCTYCITLSQRLQTLKNNQEELADLIRKFDEASQRSEKNIALMQTNNAIIGRKLNTMSKKAAGLTDELSIMITAGENIAVRLETAADHARATTLRTKRGTGRAA